MAAFARRTRRAGVRARRQEEASARGVYIAFVKSLEQWPHGSQDRVVRLSGSERRELRRIVNARRSEQALVFRAKIVLLSAQGRANKSIPRELGCDVKTVRKWTERFAGLRLAGLQDSPRSGRPPIFSPETRCLILNRLLTPPPEGLARWTLSDMRDVVVRDKIVPSISRETIGNWLRMADIKIHRVKYWLNPKDPNFEIKMRRVVGLYLHPPRSGTVLCLDEKTGIQAKEQIAPAKPARPGQIRKVEWEYRRHGTVSLMASFEVSTGKVVGRCIKHNDSSTFISFLKQLMRIYPHGRLYLIMDNGSSHTSEATRAFLAKHKRLNPVYLPVHASWLNQIEIWFSVLTRKSLKDVSLPSQEALRKQIQGFIRYHNRFLKHPYRWTYAGRPLLV